MRPILHKNSALLSKVVFKRDARSIKPRIVNHPAPRVGHTDPLELFKGYTLFTNTQLAVELPPRPYPCNGPCSLLSPGTKDNLSCGMGWGGHPV